MRYIFKVIRTFSIKCYRLKYMARICRLFGRGRREIWREIGARHERCYQSDRKEVWKEVLVILLIEESRES